MNAKFFEPSRSAMSASAASIGRPRLASASTRWNSFLDGSCASSTSVWMPCLKLWPALSDAATAISRSGSCSSNAVSRLRAFRQTKPMGSERAEQERDHEEDPVEPHEGDEEAE